ncbi:MAG: hypothetical protein SVY10_03015 [Thermodesulfobacteriota bacterium]|nr:hypothetical protein [Thermodesulfobacteriota bacterium]
MIEKALNKIAEQILGFDEASLRTLRAKYRMRMNDFDTSKEWERAVIVYFIINSVITKNALFNKNVLEGKRKKGGRETKERPDLKVIE